MPKQLRGRKPSSKPIFAEIDAYRRQVNAAMASEDYAVAIEYLEKLVKIVPRDEGTWTLLGVAYGHLQDLRKAVGCFERALQLNSQNATTWLDLGIAYGSLGNTPKAISAFEYALQLNPQSTLGWSNLGITYMNRGDIPKAITCWERILQMDAKVASAWTNLGAAYLRLGQSQQALQYCEKAVQLDSHNPIAWANLGAAHNNLEHYPDALKAYRKALQLKPDLIESVGPIVRKLEAYLGKTPKQDEKASKSPKQAEGRPKRMPSVEDGFTLDTKDPYEFFNRLGERLLQQYHISPDTSFEEITDIWKQLVRFLHPDSNPYAAEELTKKLNEAYQRIKRERNL